MVCVCVWRGVGAGGNPIILQASPPHTHTSPGNREFLSWFNPSLPSRAPPASDELSPSSRNKLGEGEIAALTHSHSQLQLRVSRASGWGSIQECPPPGPEARTACWSPPLPSTHFRCPKLGQQRSFPVGQLAPAPLPLPCSGPRLPPPRAPRGLTTSQPPFDTWGLCGAGGRDPPSLQTPAGPGRLGRHVSGHNPLPTPPPPPAPPALAGTRRSLTWGGVGGGKAGNGKRRPPPLAARSRRRALWAPPHRGDPHSRQGRCAGRRGASDRTPPRHPSSPGVEGPERALKGGGGTAGAGGVGRGAGGERGRWRLSRRPPPGPGARLWKRKKPNSPAGNFPRAGPPLSGAAPTPHATGPGPTHSARGRGGRGGVVLVRVRQPFHSLCSSGPGVSPSSRQGDWGRARRRLALSASRGRQAV